MTGGHRESRSTVWRDPWMWLGGRDAGAVPGEGAPVDLLRLAGASRCWTTRPSATRGSTPPTWPPATPSWCWLPSEPSAFGQADADEVSAGFGGARVELVDGRALTWYGPRISAALAAFRDLFGGTG
jgi:hypothetical protein